MDHYFNYNNCKKRRKKYHLFLKTIPKSTVCIKPLYMVRTDNISEFLLVILYSCLRSLNNQLYPEREEMLKKILL